MRGFILLSCLSIKYETMGLQHSEGLVGFTVFLNGLREVLDMRPVVHTQISLNEN